MHRTKRIYQTLVIAAFSLIAAQLCTPGQPAIAQGLPEPISEEDFRPFDPARARLGQLLFYDKILSGNRNISCATCHAVEFGTSDGLSLGIGEGGIGVGTERVIVDGPDRPFKRVPRNAPALFNLGHKSVRVMFHDGRVSNEDVYGNGFNSPVEEWLPEGLQSVLAAQALIPLTSKVEMAGSPDENEIAAAINRRIDLAWPAIAARISSIPEYVTLFSEAYPGIETPADITPVHIANALDDFQNSEYRSFDSPFDRYLRGDTTALSDVAQYGLRLFYGEAGCSQCHSGPLLTDQDFHALALPPLGPGRTRRFDPYARDVGRMAETDDLADAYRFRTPSLRNVSLTGPWGHNGSFATLEGIVRHHLDPLASLQSWDPSQVILTAFAPFKASDLLAYEDHRELARLTSRLDIEPRRLSNADVSAILSFLDALTDCSSLAGRLGKPTKVPSNLSVDQVAGKAVACAN